MRAKPSEKQEHKTGETFGIDALVPGIAKEIPLSGSRYNTIQYYVIGKFIGKRKKDVMEAQG